jgi:hypothetical protein
VLVLLLLSLLGPGVVPDGAFDPGLAVSPAEDRALRSDGAFARVVASDDPTEVVTLAATPLRADADRVVACALEPGCLSRPVGGSSGRLGARPVPADLAGLRFDREEIEALRGCRVGRCALRLPPEAIETLRQRVDWSLPSAPERAEDALRESLAGLAVLYLDRGHAALPPYADGPNGTRVGEGTDELLRRPLPGLDEAPELRDYLRTFPSGRPVLSGEALVWRRERMYRREVVSLEHVVVVRRDGPRGERVLVVSKKLYSSHYFEGSLEVAEFARRRGEAEGRLVVARRSRTDVRPSGFSWIERLLLRRLVRGRIEAELRELRARLEGLARP